MAYYIAYGSNLNMAQMKMRCPDATPVDSAMLKGWHLVFRRSYLTIEKKAGGEVPVGIWKISKGDEKRLDRYEGFPTFYGKYDVVLGGGKHGIIYIMNTCFPVEEPTDRYLETCLQGYDDFGFDESYIMTALAESRKKGRK